MKNVIVYTTPTCGYCKMVKEFFGEHKVTFKEKDVSTDQAAAQEMIDKSGQMGVPVIVVAGDKTAGEKEKIIVGFDKERLSAALGIGS